MCQEPEADDEEAPLGSFRAGLFLISRSLSPIVPLVVV